jgi:hypothetical protein
LSRTGGCRALGRLDSGLGVSLLRFWLAAHDVSATPREHARPRLVIAASFVAMWRATSTSWGC